MTQPKPSNNKKKPEQKQKQIEWQLKKLNINWKSTQKKPKKRVKQQHCKRRRTITQEVLNKPIKNFNYKPRKKQISMVYGCKSQIYKLHRFVLFEICYFIGLYYLNTNVMHYLNTKIMCMTFLCKQHK
jgi:hypothetical protein